MTMDAKTLAQLERQIRETDMEALAAYKAGKAEAPVIYKAEGHLKAGAEKQGGMDVFVASEESEDRKGDVIAVAGWQLDNFLKNPVLMFGHDYGVAPVGTVAKVWAEGKQLLDVVSWDEADPLAAFLKGKYDRKIMRAQSVGFRPIEFEEVAKDGQPWPSLHFKKQELIEISMVPIPMHPLALRKAMASGHFTIIMPEIVKVAEPPAKPVRVVKMKMPDEMKPKMTEAMGHMDEARRMMGEMMDMADDDMPAEDDGKGAQPRQPEDAKGVLVDFRAMLQGWRDS